MRTTYTMVNMQKSKKAIFLISIILILSASVIFASPNGQRIFEAGSPIIKEIETLFILEGRALPSSTGPWPESELKIMLSKVSQDTYPELYDKVYSTLYGKTGHVTDSVIDMNWESYLDIIGFAHTNTSFSFDYNNEENYIHRINREPAFLRLDWETWAGDGLYTFFQLELLNYKNAGGHDFDSYNFNFNIAFLTPSGITGAVDFDQPYRGFVSFGGDYWNVQIGRDRLVAGNGQTGNLVLSNNIRYHNLFKFSMFGERYKYSFTLSFLAHPVNTKWFKELANHSSMTSTKGLAYYMSHRFETRLLKDKIDLTITESIMFQSEEGTFDPRYLSPLALFHNFWIKTNANSLIALEASYSLAKGLILYGQICLDDFAITEERAAGDQTPNAFGYMAGLRTRHILGSGVLSANLEFAFTDPYLYLRSLDGNTQKPGEYGLGYIDYIVRRDSVSPKFLGYTYGGDAIVGDIKVEYSKVNAFTLGAEFFAMLHGEKNIGSLFQRRNDERTPTGTATYTMYLELYFDYIIRKNMNVFAQYDFVHSNNKTDNQFVLGMEISLL